MKLVGEDKKSEVEGKNDDEVDDGDHSAPVEDEDGAPPAKTAVSAILCIYKTASLGPAVVEIYGWTILRISQPIPTVSHLLLLSKFFKFCLNNQLLTQ